MDISGVSIPAVPEAQSAPPRDAQLQAAVRETAETEPQQNDTQSETNSGSERRPDPTSSLGHNIDERA